MVANKQQKSNSDEGGERVYLTFNSTQLKLIDSLIGEIGDNRADVVKATFLNWLSEKNITPSLVRKRLGIDE